MHQPSDDAAGPLARWRPPAWAWLVPFACAAALLSIGVTRDWRLVHEDNGALHTTFARGHLDLGLARTYGHDVFHRPATGETTFYGHHPPGTSLLLAGAFVVLGSDAPWAARSVAIVFHLASLALFMALLRIHLPPAAVLCGGLVFAVLPMSAFFGRMVNYEVPCFTGVLLQLYGYARWRSDLPGARGFALLALGVVLAGVVDWPAFFFAAALGGVELLAALGGERAAWRRFAAIACVATAVLLLDVVHLAVAAGSLGALRDVVGSKQESVVVTPWAFLGREWTHGRRFFGRGPLLASALVLIALAVPAAPLGAELRRARHARVLAGWLGASFAAALAYALAAPSWAMVHAYWSFYFLPFVATAVVLAVAALATAATAPGATRWLALALLAALLVDLGLTSAKTLATRHTTDEEFAVRRTRELRADYLPPRSAPPSGASP